MYEFWTTPAANMMYTRLQKLQNMMVDEYGIQTIAVVVVALLFLLLSFDIFIFTSTHPLLDN